MTQAVIFDLDGTLVDSAPAICGIGNRMLEAEGLRALSLDEARGYVGHGAAVFVKQALAARGEAENGAVFDRRLRLFQQAYRDDDGSLNTPYPRVEQALQAFRNAGLKVGLCTNKPFAPTQTVLRVVGWQDTFDMVVGGDTLPKRKPDPAPLLHTIEQLGGVKALFVGDSEVDAETARAADVPFALFTPGYRKAPVEALPHDFAFDDYDALVERVLGG